VKKNSRSDYGTLQGSTQLVLILGRPLGHSFSPAMQNAAFRALGLNWAYVPLELPAGALVHAVELLRGSNVRGANVTVPYKEPVASFLDGMEKTAKRLGSVNTLYRRGKKLLGASTDGEGFLRSLGPRRGRLKGSQGLLLGAGGAARSVAASLAASGVKGVFIANRSTRRAVELAKSLSQFRSRLRSDAVSLREGEKVLPKCDWIIQATSAGLKPGDRAPLSLRKASPGTLVVDLIYHRETSFLQEARRLGLPHLSGLGMLLHQGALSFELWTGRRAPLGVMAKALRNRLRAPSRVPGDKR
jgi:shikimate dehydrogenase